MGGMIDMLMGGAEPPLPTVFASPVEPPKVEPVTAMPNEDEVKSAKRRSVARQRARSGRASTIFSEGEGLGG